MKICENCGMEYGDDGSFCPYCDERYGVVIAENDVISADFPAYSEEFPVIGETAVKQESFADNQEDIFDRNIRLAEIEKLLPKVEVKKVYKPVVPLVQVGGNGSIAPYKSHNLITKKFFHRRENKRTVKISKFRKIMCILASIYLIIFILFIAYISWFKTNDTHRLNEQFKEVKKETEKSIEWDSSALGIPEEINFKSENGIEMQLTFVYKMSDIRYYRYSFNMKNTMDSDIYSFWEDLAPPQYAQYRLHYMIANWSRHEKVTIEWQDDVPVILNKDGECCLKSGESVEGDIWIYFID